MPKARGKEQWSLWVDRLRLCKAITCSLGKKQTLEVLCPLLFLKVFGLLFGSGGCVSVLVIASCEISPAVLSQIKISSEMNNWSIGICGCWRSFTWLKLSVQVSSFFVSLHPLCAELVLHTILLQNFRKDKLCDGMRLLVLTWQFYCSWTV